MVIHQAIATILDSRDNGVRRRLVEAAIERQICVALKPFTHTKCVRQLYLIIQSRRFRVEAVVCRQLLMSSRHDDASKMNARLRQTAHDLISCVRRSPHVRLSTFVADTYRLAEYVLRQGTA